MKKIGFIVQFLCLALFSFGQSAGDGIRFIEGEKWENVLKMAQEQDKYIFMDCYTSWCGPCKALAKDIFTRKDVGDFFNANFINVKYDMEKGVGKDLYKHYKSNIIGFPTLLLINKEGKVVHQMAGFQEANVLIDGMKAGMEGKSLFAYKDRYAAGERELAFLKDYVVALQGAFLKDDIENIVLDYMKTIPVEKLQEKEIWDFVGAYIKDPYSPQFDYVIFNIDRLANKVKFDRYSVERQLGWALERAVDQVVEVKFDKDGVPLRLVDAAGKVDTLLRLIDRGNLKRAETAQYLAAYCPDKAVIEKYLTLIEKLQQEEDKGSSKLRSYYYGTLSVLHAKLGNAARAKEFKKMDEKIKAEKAKEFESFLKKSN